MTTTNITTERKRTFPPISPSPRQQDPVWMVRRGPAFPVTSLETAALPATGFGLGITLPTRR